VFFVLGCQKSGPTWLQHLLDAHRSVRCGGEGHIADLLVPLLQQALNAYNHTQAQRSGGLGVSLARPDLIGAAKVLGDRLLARYLSESGDPSATLAVGDKTPEYAVVIPVLNQLYSEARFIHIIRDGRDGAVSGWAHLKRQGRTEKFPTFADYAAYFAEHHWLSYITAARDAARELGDRYLELRYEDLHADAAQQTRRML